MSGNVKKQEALITFKVSSPRSNSLFLSWTVENALPLQAVNAVLIDSNNYSVSIVLPVENSGSVTVPNIPKQTYTVYLAVIDTENNSYISNPETITVNAEEEGTVAGPNDDELKIVLFKVQYMGGMLCMRCVCVFESPLTYARIDVVKDGIQICSIDLFTQVRELTTGRPIGVQSNKPFNAYALINGSGYYNILLDIRDGRDKKTQIVQIKI